MTHNNWRQDKEDTIPSTSYEVAEKRKKKSKRPHKDLKEETY